MPSEPMTWGELKAAMADVPDYVWVCLKDGPLQIVERELGASEPFVLLEAVQRCVHGVPKDETCVPCEHVKELMAT